MNCRKVYNPLLNTNSIRDEASKDADGVALSYMLRGGASLTKPLTPSEASSPMSCRLSGEEAEIGESPDFSRGECQYSNLQDLLDCFYYRCACELIKVS